MNTPYIISTTHLSVSLSLSQGLTCCCECRSWLRRASASLTALLSLSLAWSCTASGKKYVNSISRSGWSANRWETYIDQRESRE